MEKSRSVCIIGGGFAGLAAAVFLDNLGLKVTLLEKKPVLGGRAYSFRDRKTETWVDNGQHLLMGAYHETLRLIEHLGVTRHLKKQSRTQVALISEKNRRHVFKLGHLPPPLNFVSALFRLSSIPIKDRLKTYRLYRELKTFKKNGGGNLANLTVEQWLVKLGQSKKARTNFWDILTLAVLNDRPEVANAEMLAQVLVKAFLGSKQDAALILPKIHLSGLLAYPALKYLDLRGQDLRLSTGVKTIHILDNHVCSLSLESGESLKADYYISAVPFKALLRLIPEGFVAATPYFANLKKLQNSPILSFNFWFDRNIMDDEFTGSAGTNIHWFFNKNKIYETNLTLYHVMGVTSGAYAWLDKPKEEILEMALTEIHTLFPMAKNAKLVHSLVNMEREATLSPQINGNEWRPPQRSPYPNFYVIGDWTQTGLPATIESAVLSARLAVDDMLARSGTQSTFPQG